MIFRAHIPGGVPIAVDVSGIEVNSLEELEAVPFVAQFKRLNGFKRFSWDLGRVMCECEHVNHTHVVGFLTPGWLPQYEDPEA